MPKIPAPNLGMRGFLSLLMVLVILQASMVSLTKLSFFAGQDTVAQGLCFSVNCHALRGDLLAAFSQ